MILESSLPFSRLSQRTFSSKQKSKLPPKKGVPFHSRNWPSIYSPRYPSLPMSFLQSLSNVLGVGQYPTPSRTKITMDENGKAMRKGSKLWDLERVKRVMLWNRKQSFRLVRLVSWGYTSWFCKSIRLTVRWAPCSKQRDIGPGLRGSLMRKVWCSRLLPQNWYIVSWIRFFQHLPTIDCVVEAALNVMGHDALQIWGGQWIKLLALIYEGVTVGFGSNRCIGGQTAEGRASRVRVQLEIERIMSTITWWTIPCFSSSFWLWSVSRCVVAEFIYNLYYVSSWKDYSSVCWIREYNLIVLIMMTPLASPQIISVLIEYSIALARSTYAVPQLRHPLFQLGTYTRLHYPNNWTNYEYLTWSIQLWTQLQMEILEEWSEWRFFYIPDFRLIVSRREKIQGNTDRIKSNSSIQH